MIKPSDTYNMDTAKYLLRSAEEVFKLAGSLLMDRFIFYYENLERILT